MDEFSLTPRKIVEELDKYVIGQDEAKRVVAIAIRNRWRRQKLPPELREEVAPKNIMLIGPTGVGKTEIARRLAALVKAPFLKIEATKYTEIGYVGRNVDSMIRDLVEVSINMIKQEEISKVQKKAEKNAEERLLDILLPKPAKNPEPADEGYTRAKIREKYRQGQLDSREIELQVEERHVPYMQVFSEAGMEELGFDVGSMLGFPSKKKTKKVSVKDAKKILQAQESEKLIDRDKVLQEGMRRAQESGLIFVDEIDKIVATGKATSGPDVSREGVQRDLLPIVEGSTVMTRYGTVKTDYILFIAAGAFSNTRPTDLIPELQGRFPLRAELKSLDKGDFIKILTEPKNALIKQYKSLLETEGVQIEFTQDAIEEMAGIAAFINSSLQNIGARRLHTVAEKVLDEISFNASDISPCKITIDKKYVQDRLKDIAEDEDLRKYIL